MDSNYCADIGRDFVGLPNRFYVVRRTPAPETARFPALLDSPAPQVRTYPVYTVVAEKFEPMAKRGFANTRMKDFHDVRFLTRRFFRGRPRTSVRGRAWNCGVQQKQAQDGSVLRLIIAKKPRVNDPHTELGDWMVDRATQSLARGFEPLIRNL